jgi:hypothetical protein
MRFFLLDQEPHHGKKDEEGDVLFISFVSVESHQSEGMKNNAVKKKVMMSQS